MPRNYLNYMDILRLYILIPVQLVMRVMGLKQLMTLHMACGQLKKSESLPLGGNCIPCVPVTISLSAESRGEMELGTPMDYVNCW